MLLASDYDKSRFLKATDLDREKKFRIKTVTEEELGIGKDKEKKLCVWFTNDERALVLNKTNNRTLRSAFGDNTAGWATKVIAVFPTMVDIRGKVGPALRVNTSLLRMKNLRLCRSKARGPSTSISLFREMRSMTVTLTHLTISRPMVRSGRTPLQSSATRSLK